MGTHRCCPVARLLQVHQPPPATSFLQQYLLPYPSLGSDFRQRFPGISLSQPPRGPPQPRGVTAPGGPGAPRQHPLSPRASQVSGVGSRVPGRAGSLAPPRKPLPGSASKRKRQLHCSLVVCPSWQCRCCPHSFLVASFLAPWGEQEGASTKPCVTGSQPSANSRSSARSNDRGTSLQVLPALPAPGEGQHGHTPEPRPMHLERCGALVPRGGHLQRASAGQNPEHAGEVGIVPRPHHAPAGTHFRLFKKGSPLKQQG